MCRVSQCTVCVQHNCLGRLWGNQLGGGKNLVKLEALLPLLGLFDFLDFRNNTEIFSKDNVCLFCSYVEVNDKPYGHVYKVTTVILFVQTPLKNRTDGSIPFWWSQSFPSLTFAGTYQPSLQNMCHWWWPRTCSIQTYRENKGHKYKHDEQTYYCKWSYSPWEWRKWRRQSLWSRWVQALDWPPLFQRTQSLPEWCGTGWNYAQMENTAKLTGTIGCKRHFYICGLSFSCPHMLASNVLKSLTWVPNTK